MNFNGEFMEISGKFEVSLNPLDSYAQGIHSINLGRMSIDKTFSGDFPQQVREKC